MPTFGDLEAYLKRAAGWVPEPNLAHGRVRRGDHARYSKELPDGTRFRTKVSGHPREEIGDSLFAHILRDQLRVSEDEFWDLVRGRGEAQPIAEAQPPARPGVPGWLVDRLLESVGLDEETVLNMSPEQAQAAWEEYRSRPRP